MKTELSNIYYLLLSVRGSDLTDPNDSLNVTIDKTMETIAGQIWPNNKEDDQ